MHRIFIKMETDNYIVNFKIKLVLAEKYIFWGYKNTTALSEKIYSFASSVGYLIR